MPMNTTFVIGVGSSSRAASTTCPRISADDKLRLKPWWPVAQNAQSSAQPACEEMHSVPRFGFGDEHGLDGLARADVQQPLARAVRGVLALQHVGQLQRSRSRRAACAARRSRSVIAPKSVTWR